MRFAFDLRQALRENAAERNELGRVSKSWVIQATRKPL